MGLTDKFDKRNNENEKKQEGHPDGIANYETPGSGRNLCFVQPDGKRQFLNYVYLITGEYDPEASEIKLTYTTHIVTLKGYNLGELFESLVAQVAKEITCQEERYSKEDSADVFGIQISSLT